MLLFLIMKTKTSINEKIKEIEIFGRQNSYPILLGDSVDILTKLINEHRPKKILELGTCIGYSGSIILLNAREDSVLTTIEINENSASIALQNFIDLGLKDRVVLKVGDAKDVIQNLNEKYDFIFLDGPKGQYKNYFPILKDLLNIEGILFADNIYFKGFVLKDASEFIPRGVRTIVKNLRIFIDLLKNDPSLETTFLEVGDGISISKKLKEKD